MFEIIKDYYNERKFMKKHQMEPVNFDSNFEFPNPEDLTADILSATPRPVIKVMPNELAETLPANVVAIDRNGVLKKLFESEGEEAFVYAGCLTKQILAIPGLNIIIVGGFVSWVDIPEDVLTDLRDLSKEGKVASIGDQANVSNLLLPIETMKQLWDMDQVMLGFKEFSAEKYNDENINKVVAVRLAAKRVPYLVKDRGVRTLRANLKMWDSRLRMSLL